jgi:hypothetical protein
VTASSSHSKLTEAVAAFSQAQRTAKCTARLAPQPTEPTTKNAKNTEIDVLQVVLLAARSRQKRCQKNNTFQESSAEHAEGMI